MTSPGQKRRGPGRRSITAFAISLIAAVLGGCRSLPTSFDPPEPTYALAPPGHGPLSDFADACERANGPAESSFKLLVRSGESYRWRLALVDSAERSIDVQTYLWRGDFSGRLLISRLKMAADRGVRVRLLVDDWYLRGKDRLVAALNDHPNIEIRVWNPGRNRAIGRKLEYLSRLSELNHRMHNKSFIVDNRVAISGGRNIGDEYYGLSKKYNLLDLDLLAVGPVVPRISGMFDRYWNSPQAAPAAVFHHAATVDDLPRELARRRKQLEASPLREVYPLDPQSWEDRLAGALPDMIPASAEVIYDKPGEREPSQDAAYGLRRFFLQAEEEILLLNPYLVPRTAFAEEAGRMHENGVRIAIMTNSLGSNDQTIVHHAYVKRRRPLLTAGVDLREMRFDGAIKSELDTPPVKSGFVGLHGKAVAIDRRRVFVGSFNLDPRSENLNTEMGLLVDSPELGEQLAAYMERTMAPENAWRLVLDENGRLAWESSDGTITTQPARSFWQRFQNGIFGLLPIEEHL